MRGERPGPSSGRRPDAAPTPALAAPARRAALETLLKLDDPLAGGIEALLDAQRSRLHLQPHDLALARQIASGVARQRRWLDHLLAGYIERPLPEGAAPVVASLQMGIFQYAFLERIPPHALVDDAVRLVVEHRRDSYRGLVNAVLRRVVSSDRASLLPDRSVAWPIRHSVPDWLAAEAGASLRGESLEALFAACNEEAPLQLRVTNGLDPAEVAAAVEREASALAHRPIAVERGHYLDTCLTIRGDFGFPPDRLPSFAAGHVTAMDEAAQLCVALSGAGRGMRILDFCASPGGKTSALFDAAERDARIVALDLSEKKLVRLRETLGRIHSPQVFAAAPGDPGVFIGTADDVLPKLSPGSFDLVLLDAPCSGLGTLRRHPEIRWRRRPADVARLAKEQEVLLVRAAAFVAPGGTLLYCVCTFTEREGLGAAGRFLESDARFRVASGNQAHMRAVPPKMEGAGWRTLPHRDRCDAFQIVRLRREA